MGTSLIPKLARKYPVVCYSANHFGNAIARVKNVEFIEGDIRDRARVKEAIKGSTDVIHLAGIVTDELAAMNPKLAIEINNTAMEGLCNLAVLAGIERFIYASSSGVYGTQPDNNVATELTEPRPETVYMRTKLEGETILWRYPQLCGVAVRSATCCGPAPRMRLDTIVNVFSKQAYFDGVITVHDGTQWRTNIHVQDATDFYMLLLEARIEHIRGEVFNCTWGNDNAKAIAETVAEIIPAKVNIVSDIKDARQYKMNAYKAEEKLGWIAKRSLWDAIRDNQAFFEGGGIQDPDSDIWYNTRRMASLMTQA